jgi:hypothetical protein
MTKYNQDIEIKMLLYYSRLSERCRRHYASIEASKLGYGGKKYIGKLLSISQKTIRKADAELSNESLYESVSNERQRKVGGGRKKNQQ